MSVSRSVSFYGGVFFRFFLAFSVVAQQQPPRQQGPADEPTVTFKSSSTLVIVTVFVRDRNGNPVENLKKEDFKLVEDGKPQEIGVFEFQKLEDPVPAAPVKPPALSPARTDEPPKPVEAKPKGPNAITPSRPGEVRYKDRRLIAMLFDFAGMPQPDQLRAQEGALKYLREQMSPSDVVSILTFANALKVEQDFTADRDRLIEVIKGFRIGEGTDVFAAGETGDEDEQDTQAAFTADQSEFNIFNTDKKLSALESAAKMLGSLPERKALIYFSSGVGRTGTENESQLRSTINAAVRSNVAFYPIDSRGLVALPPGGDASSAAPRGSGIFSGQTQGRQRQQFNSQQETLTTLAHDTGGKALIDDNELSLGITQAQEDMRSYYILGYYSTNGALDGKYRKVVVSFSGTAHAGLKLDYRQGYFSSKEFKKFTSTDKERQLEEALLLGDPLTDLPLALEVDYFRLTPERYFIPVSVKIPGSEISVAKKGSNGITALDFIGQIRDAKGAIVGSVRDGIQVKLSEEDSAQLAKRNMQYDTGFTLPPGKYKLKFLARENQTGKMGTFETSFTIPDLTVSRPGLAISSVVWSNQREALTSAVGSATNKRKLFDIHPLIADGQKLVPSITRVFRKDQQMFVYFEVYDPATDPAQKTPSVAATLSFYRGRAKVSESEPVRVTTVPKARPHMAPFQFQAPLAKLAPGRYTCQVSVVDELGRKFAFARSPIVVMP